MRTLFYYGGAVALASTFLFSGCGALKQDLADTQAELEQVQSKRDQLASELKACNQASEALRGENEKLSDSLNQNKDQLATCRANFEDLKQSSKLQGKQLEERLAELRALKEKAEANEKLYDDLVSKLQSMIDAGQLEVTNERGRLFINLPQDILFGSGSAQLGDEGVQAITQVGEVLATIGERRFQVEGHTDNVPISTSRFPSNWELSTARALSVVKILIDAGVKPSELSGAGYGEFAPRFENDTKEHKAKNRRIEIVLVPEINFNAEKISKTKKKK